MTIDYDKITHISSERVKSAGEVFTPAHIVQKMCNMVDLEYWKDPNTVFLEPACGNGNFIVAIFEKRINNGVTAAQALNTLFGLDIMQDNIEACHSRLLSSLKAMLKKTKIGPASKRHQNIITTCGMIMENNIYVVEDSISHIKNGGFDNKCFVFKDPTGNNQILSATEQEKLRFHAQKKFLDIP